MPKIPPEWVFAGLAFLGGLARYMDEYNRTGIFKWRKLVANIVISGFAGFMLALCGQAMSMPQEILWIFSGIGGFMGTAAIELVARYVTRKMDTAV